MLIGEQPGAQEDLTGEPFVGPAGQLLDKALDEAGLKRETLYLTNTVKHFKYEMRGKARLHKRANASEQAACRGWLAAELSRVEPAFVNSLDMTLRPKIERLIPKLTPELQARVPAAVLRMPQPERRHAAYAETVADLHELAVALAGRDK